MSVTKQIWGLVLVLVFVLPVSGYAAPVPDYALGHVRLDADSGYASFSPDYGDDGIGWDAALTAGLGFGFAGQVSYSDYKVSGGDRLKKQEINLYDHLLGPVGVFVGTAKTATSGAAAQNGLVCGVAGSLPIAPRTSVQAVLSAGTHSSGKELGISYQLSQNADLSLIYHNNRYDGIKFADGTERNVRLAGYFAGLTYKL